MKKLFIIVSFMLVSLSLSAGNDKADNADVYYGGQEGDFSLSFNALPVINFVGNLFNGTTNQSFSGFGSVNPSVFNGTSLSAKFFASDKMNIVVGAGFNCLSNKSFDYDENHINKESVSITGSNEFMFMLGANYLIYPGKRLQPIIGANLVYARANKNFQKVDDKEYTNSDTSNKTPQNTFGMIANLGVEFFFCKNISMSALLDLGLTSATSKVKVDNWDEDYSYITSKQNKFMTGRMGGNLAINFYF